MFNRHKAILCLVLAAVMTYAPSLAYCQAPVAVKTSEGPRAVDTSAVAPGATLAAVAFPRRVLTSPSMWMMPIEVLSAAGKKELGIDPVDVEQIVLVVQAPSPTTPPGGCAVVHLAKPYQLADLFPSIQNEMTAATIDGKPARRCESPMGPSYYMPDEKTLVIGMGPMLQAVIANRAKPVESELSGLLSRLGASADYAAVLRMEPLRPLLNMQLVRAPIPDEFAGVRKLPGMIDRVELKANLVGGFGSTLAVTAKDEAAAADLEKMVDQWMKLARARMRAEMAKDMQRMAKSDDPVERALAQYTERISGTMLELVRPVRQGDQLRLQTGEMNYQAAQLATIGILVALLLPAVQAAREAGRRAASINNMKLIGLAMHNYHDAHKRFPARAIFDKDGKPLLSWRVAILPYLGEEKLYKEFHLDEPWNSEHNLKLVQRMPKVYRNPSSAAAPNLANYLVPVGPGTIFEGKTGRSIRDITDGPANTVMLVEANDDRAVPWTKPDDWTFDPKSPLDGLGKAHPGIFCAAFGDVSVRCISEGIDPAVWKALLSRAGNESLDSGVGQ